MSAWLRRSLYSSLGILWLTGCAWLVLHFFFPAVTDFGPSPNPLEPRLMIVHGVLAVPAIFLFGWIAGTHIGAHWRSGARRVTGVSIATAMTVLISTGLAGYYLTSEPLRQSSSILHETVGVIALIPTLFHWLRR